MKSRHLVLLLSVVVACIVSPPPAIPESPGRMNSVPPAVRLFEACEGLRCQDPGICQPAIDQLFEVPGLISYTILHLKWIAEANPEIRNHILEKYSRPGDHRHIADPAFPQEWVDAANRFPPEERNVRLQELHTYFPGDMERHAMRSAQSTDRD